MNRINRMYNELIDVFLEGLYDRKELMEKVAREKGYKLPEPKMSTRINK